MAEREQELKLRFPEIAWDEPVRVVIAGHGAVFACRYCIALYGLRGEDVLNGDASAWIERERALDHIWIAHRG